MTVSILSADLDPPTPRPPAVVLPFRVPAARRLSIADDVDAPRPDGQTSVDVFEHLASLISDPRTTLTLEQQAAARAELDALVLDGTLDAVREDPSCPTIALPGRAAVAALRIIMARGLLRAEWDT